MCEASYCELRLILMNHLDFNERFEAISMDFVFLQDHLQFHQFMHRGHSMTNPNNALFERIISQNDQQQFASSLIPKKMCKF